MTKKLPIYTVYFDPSDYPNQYVARRFLSRAEGEVVTDDYFVSDHLALVRAWVAGHSLLCGQLCDCVMPRAENDPPQIIESWI